MAPHTDDAPNTAVVTHESQIVDKRGHTTKFVFKSDGSVAIWQWHSGFEHTGDDDLIVLNPAEAEEALRHLEEGLHRA